MRVTNKTKLNWVDISILLSRDNANRWLTREDEPAAVEYLQGYRAPSRAWPNSYATALSTRKFASWLIENYPSEAERFALLKNDEEIK